MMHAPLPLWTRETAAAATGGRAVGDWAVTGISIDSRSVQPGDLFVALQGPNFDGHNFVADALAKGAVAAMVHRWPAGLERDDRLMLVVDTLSGLGDLARASRARTAARIAAVTGSVGKTGTKEALRLALSRQGPTHASVGSFNNHWGLPLSLARMPGDSAFGIFEMGMNHPGEILPLSRMARPHVAVVTTVEAVHKAHFESVEQIAEAKAEIFCGLVPGGVAVLNLDNPHFPFLEAAARAAGAQVLSFGRTAGAAARLIAESLDAEGSDVVAEVAGRQMVYRVGAPGAHWVANSLAVLATAQALGADVAQAAGALADLTPPAGRGARRVVHLAGGDLLLVDESYNASPVSMRAAIAVLERLRPAPGGRRIAVLGDMLELGDAAAEQHAALADVLVAAGVDLVFTAGPNMAGLRDALPADRRGAHGADSAELEPAVTAALAPGDVVMVKGSAGSRMGRIVTAVAGLEGLAQPAQARRAGNGG